MNEEVIQTDFSSLNTVRGSSYLKEFLQTHELTGLHCGCRTRLLEGFLNVDLRTLRLSDGSQTSQGQICLVSQRWYFLQEDLLNLHNFEDETFYFVLAEHFVEHLTLGQAITWLAQVRRILAKGGIVRISTPDLARYVTGYFEKDSSFFDKQRQVLETKNPYVPPRRALMFNQLFWQYGHQWIYDLEELRYLSHRAGFTEGEFSVYSYKRGTLGLAEFDQYLREHESLYIELRKLT